MQKNNLPTRLSRCLCRAAWPPKGTRCFGKVPIFSYVSNYFIPGARDSSFSTLTDIAKSITRISTTKPVRTTSSPSTSVPAPSRSGNIMWTPWRCCAHYSVWRRARKKNGTQGRKRGRHSCRSSSNTPLIIQEHVDRSHSSSTVRARFNGTLSCSAERSGKPSYLAVLSPVVIRRICLRHVGPGATAKAETMNVVYSPGCCVRLFREIPDSRSCGQLWDV